MNQLTINSFFKGMNNSGDPTAIGDDECSDIADLDICADGSLCRRPTYVSAGINVLSLSRLVVLGTYTLAGVPYVIIDGGTGYYAINGTSLIIISTGSAIISGVCQYLGRLWMVASPNSSVSGGYWTPGGGYVSVPTMPKGQTITMYKDRLWISAGPLETINDSRLYFSAVADGTSWNGTDFFDIAKGNGQNLIDIFVMSNTMYLFKSGGVYAFQYDTSPTRAVLSTIATDVGVSNPGCVASYNGIIYFLSGNKLIALNGYQYLTISNQVDFTKSSEGTGYDVQKAVSVLGDRVIVSYYGATYVFFTQFNSWVRWTPYLNSRVFPWVEDTGNSRYVSALLQSTIPKLIRITDAADNQRSSDTTTVTPSLTTKYYDMGDPTHYKKLRQWSAEVVAANQYNSSVAPIVYGYSVLWSQVASNLWSDLASRPWNQLSSTGISSATTGISPVTQDRILIRLMKTLRFRRVAFQISLPDDKTYHLSQRLFNVNAEFSNKENVSKAVN
jgi:hypothetical protein